MLGQLVVPESSRSRIPLIAVREMTDERLPASMGRLMSLQVPLRLKRCFANIAFKWFFTSMFAHMSFKIAELLEFLKTVTIRTD